MTKNTAQALNHTVYATLSNRNAKIQLKEGTRIYPSFERDELTALTLENDPAGVRIFMVRTSDLIAALD